MIELITYILKNIVGKPDALVVEEAEENAVVTYKITADPEDNGRIIGKQGKIIQALRNICKILAIKENKQIRIEIA